MIASKKYCTRYLHFRNGKLCYEYSYNRRVILNARGRHGVTSHNKDHKVTYTRWVISPFSDLETVPVTTDVPLLTITIDFINTTCPFVSTYKTTYVAHM